MAKENYFYFGGVGALLFYVVVFVGFYFLVAAKNRSHEEPVAVTIDMGSIPESMPLSQPVFKPQPLPTFVPSQSPSPHQEVKSVTLPAVAPQGINLSHVGVKSLSLPTSPVSPVNFKRSVTQEEKNSSSPPVKLAIPSLKVDLKKASPLVLTQGKVTSAQLAKLSSLIYDQWTPASGEEGLQAKIGIKISPQGDVLVRLAGSSGNEKFDQKLMNIVHKVDYAILFPEKTPVDVVVSFKVKDER